MSAATATRPMVRPSVRAAQAQAAHAAQAARAQRGSALPAPVRETPQRHIEIVTTRSQRRARPKVVHAVVTLGALFVIFGAQLLLSIAVSDGAYQIASLQQTAKELSRTEAALAEDLDVLGSAQNLVANAASLGMVIATDPSYLRLADGALVAAPPATIRFGCTTMCGMVGNSLTAGLPLVNPVAQPGSARASSTIGTTAGTPSGTATGTQTTTPPTISGPTTEPLPAPVTQ